MPIRMIIGLSIVLTKASRARRGGQGGSRNRVAGRRGRNGRIPPWQGWLSDRRRARLCHKGSAEKDAAMAGLRPDVDPDGLQEFSVVFTDRSLNHMSQKFQGVMRDISATLREVYGAEAVALVPGGGTCAMEAVARQFGRDAHALIVRNGFFSYRWSQILEAGGFAHQNTVMMARPQGNTPQPPFAPVPIEEVVARIREARPDAVFAPHVETAAGMILPDDYIKALAQAAHEAGAIMVLYCIASGAIWVDMKATGVDVLISAPQKCWSASPSAGMVMLSPRAIERLETTVSDSVALDVKKWRAVMQDAAQGGH